MNPDVYKVSDRAELRAWIEAEGAAIECLVTLSEALRVDHPERSIQIYVEAKGRTRDLLAIYEWLSFR